MEKNLYIDASHPNEIRIVLKSGEKIEDYEYEGIKNNLIKNNIYLGKVSRIEPSLQAAFVDFGRERHGFLSFNDIQSDYYQIPQSDLEKIKQEEERVREELSKKVEALKVGPGMDKSSEMGPLVTKEHLEKVKGYVDLGVKEGAKLVVDGRNIKLQGYEKGFFIGGCLFDHVSKDMRIYKEEIFGPVLSVVRAKDFNEAINLINEHEFGNGTSIYTRDGDVGRTFASKIKVGMVGINIPIPVPVAFHSFGGWKRSLFGDQHMHGPEGVRFYTKLKTITSRWPSGVRSNPEFIMPTMK